MRVALPPNMAGRLTVELTARGTISHPRGTREGRMRVKVWNINMTDAESKDLAYWERNMLALRYAQGWYNDDTSNYTGWRRVLSLDQGKITFHIPDDFDVGDLPEIEPNWDGHTTEEKWKRIMKYRGIE